VVSKDTSGGGSEGLSRFDLSRSLSSVSKTFVTALSLLTSIKVAVPLLLYFLLKLLILLLYLTSTSGFWSSFWAIFVRDLIGGQLQHYPAHLMYMLRILGRFDIAIGILVFVIFQGATILLVRSAYEERATSLGGGFSGALARYPHLAVAALLVSVGAFGVIKLISALSGLAPGLNQAVFTGAALLAGLAVQAMFLYSPVIVILEGKNAIGAVAASFRTAVRHAAKTALIVTLPFILTLPGILLSLKAEFIALRLSPDFMVYIYIINEVLHLVSAYLIISGAAIAYTDMKVKVKNAPRQ